MMRNHQLAASAMALAVAAGFCPLTAFAQSTGPASSKADTGQIAEVIVTAERREQSAQKAPLTIQVLGGNQVLKAGLADAAGLARLTTGVEIGMGGGYSQVFIRGVGGLSFSPLASPGVAFNVDGVYVGRSEGVNGNFYDLSRVEVLKGPQGTLYGRNANGGSINLITNDAALNKTTADLNFEGGNYDLAHVSGAVNLPIGDTAAIRGAFNIVNRGGYLSDGADDDVEQSGRLRFKWEPSGDITLRLNADYTHLGGKGGDYVYLPQRPGSDPYEAETTAASNAYMHGFGPLGPLLNDQLANNKQDSTLYNFSGQLDWKLGDLATLTVLPAYRHVDANFITHFGAQFTAAEVTDQSSVEVRLGHSTPALTWVVGGYYFDENAPNSVNNIFASNILQNYHIVYSPTTKAYAGFGQATIRLFDGFRLIAGARDTHEDRKLTGSITDQASSTLLENFGGQKGFDGFTYKLGGEYDLSPRNMIFITYSTGFKAGGFSQTVAPLNVYQPEKLKSLEFGSRNRFLDNRLQFNFGAYHWSYSNIQDQRVNFDPLGNVNFITFNSGDATIYGATLDIIAKPTSADTISLSGEYAHSKYDRFFFQTPVPFYQAGSSGCKLSGPYAPGAALPYSSVSGSTNTGPLPVVVGNCAGFQVARVPTWTGLLSYEHVFDLANAATITLGGNIKYASASWLGIDFISAERNPAYAVLNADMTYVAPNGKWSAGLFGRNLTKAVYYTGGIQTAFVGGLFAANIAAPMTFGVRASVKFGG